MQRCRIQDDTPPDQLAAGLAEVSRSSASEVIAKPAWGYSAYVIGDDGHVQNRVEVHCDDDEEAKRCAEQLVDGHAIEMARGAQGRDVPA